MANKFGLGFSPTFTVLLLVSYFIIFQLVWDFDTLQRYVFITFYVFRTFRFQVDIFHYYKLIVDMVNHRDS